MFQNYEFGGRSKFSRQLDDYFEIHTDKLIKCSLALKTFMCFCPPCPHCPAAGGCCSRGCWAARSCGWTPSWSALTAPGLLGIQWLLLPAYSYNFFRNFRLQCLNLVLNLLKFLRAEVDILLTQDLTTCPWVHPGQPSKAVQQR